MSNLPPGVTESMIPGNRPIDEHWERWWDNLGTEVTKAAGHRPEPGAGFLDVDDGLIAFDFPHTRFADIMDWIADALDPSDRDRFLDACAQVVGLPTFEEYHNAQYPDIDREHHHEPEEGP